MKESAQTRCARRPPRLFVCLFVCVDCLIPRRRGRPTHRSGVVLRQAMKALRERPRGPSLLASPSHSSQQFAKHRYTVASHELYLGKIFAAGGSGNVYKAHYRGRIVAAKEIVNTDTRSGSYSELSVRAVSRLDGVRGLCVVHFTGHHRPLL